MRKNPIFQMVVMGVIGCAILIPVVLLIHWFPKDASTQLGNTRTLYEVLLLASVPIFVIVETVIIFSVWKFRMKPGEELKDGPPIHGNTRLEVVWTVLPAILILGLVTYAFIVLNQNEANKKNAMLVNVTARQFEFEFSYPRGGGHNQVVSPVLYLEKGRPVLFHIRSLDVIHSFFVPSFAEKIDAVPGITTTLRVTPTALGTYPVECTELCGPGHAFMRTSAHVLTPAAFQKWLSSQPLNGTPPIGYPPAFAVQPGVPGDSKPGPDKAPSTSSAPPPKSTSSATAAAGKAVFTSSAGCSSCHTLAAAGATGTIGPDLDTRLRSDCASPASKRIRGPTLDDCIRKAITDPYAFIPPGYHAGIMPSTFAHTLTATQIQSLVDFLASDAK